MVTISENNRKKIDWDAELRANERWLKTVIATRLGEYEGVEDIWQEVSIAALEQKSPISDVEKVAPWLYRVAVIQSLLYRRKLGRRRKLIDRFRERIPLHEDDMKEPNPLDWVLGNEKQELVRDALKRIPERDRETLVLKYVYNWTYKKLAEKLGLSVPAVQSKLHRARKLFREELKWGDGSHSGFN